MAGKGTSTSNVARFEAIEESIVRIQEHVQEQVDSLRGDFQEMIKMMKSQQETQKTVSTAEKDQVHSTNVEAQSLNGIGGGVSSSQGYPYDRRPRRLEMPTFEGANPDGWILKAEQRRCMLEVTKILQSMEQKLDRWSKGVKIFSRSFSSLKQDFEAMVGEDTDKSSEFFSVSSLDDFSTSTTNESVSDISVREVLVSNHPDIVEGHVFTDIGHEGNATRASKSKEAIPSHIVKIVDCKPTSSPHSRIHISSNSRKFKTVPVFLPPDVWSKFYNGFGKQQFWPPFHYMLPFSADHSGRFDRFLWEADVSVVSAFEFDKCLEEILSTMANGNHNVLFSNPYSSVSLVESLEFSNTFFDEGSSSEAWSLVFDNKYMLGWYDQGRETAESSSDTDALMNVLITEDLQESYLDYSDHHKKMLKLPSSWYDKEELRLFSASDFDLSKFQKFMAVRHIIMRIAVWVHELWIQYLCRDKCLAANVSKEYLLATIKGDPKGAYYWVNLANAYSVMCCLLAVLGNGIVRPPITVMCRLFMCCSFKKWVLCLLKCCYVKMVYEAVIRVASCYASCCCSVNNCVAWLEFHLEDEVAVLGGRIDRPQILHTYQRHKTKQLHTEDGNGNSSEMHQGVYREVRTCIIRTWISKELGQQISVNIMLFLEFHLEDKVGLWGGGIDRLPVYQTYQRYKFKQQGRLHTACGSISASGKKMLTNCLQSVSKQESVTNIQPVIVLELLLLCVSGCRLCIVFLLSVSVRMLC